MFSCLYKIHLKIGGHMLTCENVPTAGFGCTIKFIMSRRYWKIFGATKFKAQSKKRGDSACPCQTSLTGFTARTGQAGSQLACLHWPVLVPGPEQAGFPAVSKLS
jgi:hypothetical protein